MGKTAAITNGGADRLGGVTLHVSNDHLRTLAD